MTYLDDRGCHQRGKHSAVNGRAHVPRLHCCYKLMQGGLNRVQELRRKHIGSLVVREQALPGEPACPPAPTRLPFVHLSLLWLLTHTVRPMTRRQQTGQKPTSNYLPAIVCPKAEGKPPGTKVSMSTEKKERKGEETSDIESNISIVLSP